MINPQKIYGCLALLKKSPNNEIVWRPVRATSEDAALKTLIAMPEIVNLLLSGYKIETYSAIELGGDLAPFNAGSDFLLMSNLEGKKEAIYIRVDGNYTDEFKKDLQELISKYCPSLDPVFD